MCIRDASHTGLTTVMRENDVKIYRIKGILFSILSLSGPWSGEPDVDCLDKDSIEHK